jgi:hypothetical protein
VGSETRDILLLQPEPCEPVLAARKADELCMSRPFLIV